MVDPLFVAAQRTNQSGDRGWDFRPSADREPSNLGKGALVIIGVVIALSLAASLIGRMG